MNLFRCTPDRSLDRDYLRTCAIYRLLKTKRIGQARANEIAEMPLSRIARRARASTRRNSLRGTIEIWKRGPLQDMLP